MVFESIGNRFLRLLSQKRKTRIPKPAPVADDFEVGSVTSKQVFKAVKHIIFDGLYVS